MWGLHPDDSVAGRPHARADSGGGVRASPGTSAMRILFITSSDGAVCVATVDGAVWLTHMKVKAIDHRYSGIKLPAAQVLRSALRHVPIIDEPIDAPTDHRTSRDIRYWERGRVGYLSFDFYNGAMSTQQCRRLRSAVRLARSRPTQVICLLGGHDFWSNGIHLNVIEAADDPLAS